MRDQLHLLRRTDWDVLIVLDACRADAFGQVTGRGQAVRSPHHRTTGWLGHVQPLIEDRRALYVSANPKPTLWHRQRGYALSVGLWETHWGTFGPERIPCVHPLSVNAAVLERYALPDVWPDGMVVHYLQPHGPYIGCPPLAAARWGRGEHPLYAGCHQLPRPDQLVGQGRITWQEVHAAYMGNLRLAWDAARQLCDRLPGRKIVTADHGELLGEDERFGHEPGWGERYPLLREVPWLAVEEGDDLGSDAASTTRQKLEALGYC